MADRSRHEGGKDREAQQGREPGSPDRAAVASAPTPPTFAGRSRHDELRPTLEELLERGEVQSALILKGKFSQSELAMIRAGWDKAHEVLLPAIAAAEARAADAERERDSWQRVARQYESALAERNLL